MVRTRIAPSPTGQDVHVGSVTTALMNFAYAKKNNGQFVIRIEDTDQSRLVPGGEKKMLDTLQKIGLIADESPEVGGPYAPYRQSERLDIYKKYAEELVTKGKAYYCICSPERLIKMREEQQAKKQVPKYDRLCLSNQNEIIKQIKEKNLPHVIRLLIPDGKIKFNDVIRGEITIETKNLDDQVLLKSDGFPTYHLGVVIDDYLMKITHIIRGEEWLPSTPKHIILYQAFSWKLPVFAHISLLRNPDKSKLSKRKNPVWTSYYLDQGIFPETLLNYLSLMGWSHPEEKEIFSLTEYIKVFDIKDIQKTAPIFDPVKLEWMNGMYIREMKNEELRIKIYEFYQKKYPEDLIDKTIPLIKERIKKLSDYLPLCEFFFKAPEKYEVDLAGKKEFFKKVYAELEKIIDWKADLIGESLMNLAKKLEIKNSQFFMDIRVIITGKKISPPLNESMELLGKKECFKRLTIN
ncbi:MAG: Glutamate-tRNA ligase [Candidatus Roizmanbacteria bacterium GW2011_GWA2_32_13]|uniref:Glutamate--tRNA ligase n=1 Tax=Candidatus Roizmanbacteria bacterium GW2011_GWA2_32_13 TaxID=1618475 RepID=A0A0G0BCP8_9BACT|nr:MAG: Glutamate-tRNA ligase [Candidatus Roizmanbacteria bacterium GW2011_GWA2_32_13]